MSAKKQGFSRRDFVKGSALTGVGATAALLAACSSAPQNQEEISVLQKEIQYLLDRRAIEDQVINYARLIDRKEFDNLDEVFTEDAFVDYTASGGEAGDLDATKAFLKASLPQFSSQHLMSNIECEISEDGKTAKTVVMLFNPMTMDSPAGPYTFFCGVWYHDDWVKTEDGIWKMKKRVQEFSYAYQRALDEPAT